MKLSITVDSFTPRVQNTLVGFCDVAIPELHLKICGLTVHQKGSSRWIGLPARAWIDRLGIAQRDQRGKVLYSPTLEFTDAATRDAFSRRVIEALLQFDPGAFDEEQAA